MKTIYLIRHGQTDSNSEMRFQGHTDINLNEKGLNQAKKLGEYFRDIELDSVFSSDLSRAYYTANAIASEKDMVVEKRKNLRECFFGDWEGQTSKEIMEKNPDNFEKFFNSPKDLVIENGESFLELQKRSWNEVLNIISTSKDGNNLAIVTHGGTIRAILCEILGIDLNNMWQMYVDNVGITCFLEIEGRFYIKFLNNTCFLK